MTGRRPLAALLLVTACAGPSASTAPTPGVDDLAAADRAAYEATIARLEGEVRAAFDREATLRSQLDDLGLDAGDAGTCGERLAVVEAELAQCRDNPPSRTTRGQPAPRTAPPTQTAPPPPTAAEPAVYGSVWSSEPTVSFQDPGVTVSGRLISTRSRREEVRLTITLLEDGRPIDNATKTVPVGARATVGYHHQFPRRGNSERVYTATVETDY